MASTLHGGNIDPDGEAPATGAPVRNVREVRTTDIDDQSALLRGWEQSYDQLSSGAFSGLFTEARLNVVYLFREITSRALRQTGALGPDAFAIGVPLVLEGAATFCGEACGAARLHLFSGSEEFEFHSPSGLDILGVVLPSSGLFGALADEEQAWLEPLLARPGLLRARPAELAELGTLIRESLEVLTEIGEGGAGGRHGPRLVAMERELRAALPRAVLDATLPDQPAPDLAPLRRARLMRDVRDYAARDEAEEVPTVEEICQALGVSRRTLQYCFQEAVGAKPATYLRAVRMNGARRSIKTGATVTEAATEWGFWHFGRFAREYRLLFGELPSVTQRRVAGEG